MEVLADRWPVDGVPDRIALVQCYQSSLAYALKSQTR